MNWKSSLLIGFVLIAVALSSFAEGPKKGRKPVPALPPPPTEMRPLSTSEMKRIDPHGSADQKPTMAMAREMQECSTCHGISGEKLTTLPRAAESCSSCHNSAPHSGVAEHAAKKVTCVSCHTFHRAESISWIPASGRFKGLREKPIEGGFREKFSQKAMLKKSCTDCHDKW